MRATGRVGMMVSVVVVAVLVGACTPPPTPTPPPWFPVGCVDGAGGRLNYVGPDNTVDNARLSEPGGPCDPSSGIRITVVRAPAPGDRNAALTVCNTLLATAETLQVSALGFPGVPEDAWACVPDTDAPALQVPRGRTFEATGPDGAVVRYEVSATDNGGPVTPTCSPASGSTFALGTTVVTCKATDRAGLTATARFRVAVAQGPLWLATGCYPTPAGDIWFAGPENDRDNAEVHGAASAGCTVPPTGTPATVVRAPDTAAALAACMPLVFSIGVTALGSEGGPVPADAYLCRPDTTPPTYLATRLIAGTTGATGTMPRLPPVGFDDEEGFIPAACSPSAGAVIPIGVSRVECRLTNGAGATSSYSFEVEVVAGPLWADGGCYGAADAPDLIFDGRVDVAGNTQLVNSNGSRCAGDPRPATIVRAGGASTPAEALAACTAVDPESVSASRLAPPDAAPVFRYPLPADGWLCAR